MSVYIKRIHKESDEKLTQVEFLHDNVSSLLRLEQKIEVQLEPFWIYVK